MSLLMDALRRAEADRKRRGPSDAVAPTPSATGADDARLRPVAPLDAASESTLAAGDLTAAEASLELQFAAPDDSLAFPRPGELTLEPLDRSALDLLATDRPADPDATNFGAPGVHPEETSTLPSNRALSSDLNAYFDQSQSVEFPRGTPLADMTLEDVAAHTVVGARTVFAASERPRSRHVFVAAAVLIIVLALVLGTAGVFYSAQTHTPHFVPSPAVASGVEKPRLRELPEVPLDSAAAPAADTLAGSDASSLPAVTGAAAGIAIAPSDTPMPSGATPVPSVAAPAGPMQVETAPAAPVAATAVTTAAPPPPAAAPQSPAAPATLAATLADVNAGEVRIARSRQPPTVDAAIAQAYAAFQAGDLDNAEALYSAAQRTHPRSRDVLLGLAAIGLERGDLATAYRHYSAVLAANPGDAVATAALFSMTGADGEAGAARLKLLLDSHADLPILHFTLGNWYARQRRWADAQQAYFDAARLDAGNPDYAYNLAISLDRLGQNAAAIEYYQKSLGLADSAGGNFNPADVLARISALSTAQAPLRAAP